MFFFGSFITYQVVLSLYLAIKMRKNLKRLNRKRKKKNILNFDNSLIKGQGGGGPRMWITNFLV